MSPRATVQAREQGTRRLDFADNTLAPQLYGPPHSPPAPI